MTREQAEARADRVLEVWAKETNGTVYKGGIDWNKGTRLIADALIETAQPETVRCHQCGGTVIFKQEGKEILFYHSCWSTRQREEHARLTDDLNHWKAKAEALDKQLTDILYEELKDIK